MSDLFSQLKSGGVMQGCQGQGDCDEPQPE